MKKKQHEYQATKIRPIVQMAIRLAMKHPERAEDMEFIWGNLCALVPALADKSKCTSCDRSMKITVYEADLHDALLLFAMGKAVRDAMATGLSFTEANKVYMPGLKISPATLKRQTKCDYLGLIKHFFTLLIIMRHWQ